MTPTTPVEDTAQPCPTCTEGRLGPWSHVRARGEIAMLGSRALAARECDRCHLVQVATTTPPATKTTAAERRHSPGSDLLQGVLLNLSAAIAELWKALWAALPRRRRR